MNNLVKRTITGIAYIILIAGSILTGKYFYGILFLAINILTLYEFYRMFSGASSKLPKTLGIITGSLVFILSFLVLSGWLPYACFALLVPLIMLVLIYEIYRNQDNPFVSMALLLFGIIYISVPYSLSVYLAFPAENNQQYTPAILLGLLSLIWINDTGAYVTGMLFGRHKLFERLSPKKSWEGAIGGTLFAFALGYWLNYFTPFLSRTDWLALSGLVSVFGVYGDLFESMLKRSAGVKDSGNILPGHGGILDRMDSLLFVIPASFAYLLISSLFH